MVRLCVRGVPLFDRLGNLLTDRTAPTSVGVLPGQAILLAGTADNSLGVLVHFVTLTGLIGIFVLRFHEATANVNRVELIAADAAIEQFLAASFCVEVPFIACLHHR